MTPDIHSKSSVMTHHVSPTTAALAASPQTSGFQDIRPRLSPVGWHSGTTAVCLADKCVLVTTTGRRTCGLLTIKHSWSRDHATNSVSAILPLPGQRCEAVCMNS